MTCNPSTVPTSASGIKWAMVTSEATACRPLLPAEAETTCFSLMNNGICPCLLVLQPRFIKLPTSSYFDGPAHEILVVDEDSSNSSSSSSRQELLAEVTFPKQQGVSSTELLLKQDEQLLHHYLHSAILPPETAARWYYYLAQSLEDLGDVIAAALAFQESAGLAVHSDEAAWAACKAAKPLHSIGFSSQARELLLSALGKDPTMPEVPLLLATIAYSRERYLEAASWAAISVSLGCYKGVCAEKRGVVREGYRDLSAWFEAPYQVLAASYDELVDSDDAADAAREDYRAALQKRKQWQRDQEPVMGLYQISRHHLPPGKDSGKERPVKTSL